jgi:hypothetical protein
MQVVRPVDLLIMVAVAAAVTSIVVTDSLNGWPGPVLVIAFFTFLFTRRSAHPERSGLPRSELLSTPADGAMSRSGPDWIAIVLTGVGVLLIAGVVLLMLVIYIGLAGCVPVVGSAVGAPCD